MNMKRNYIQQEILLITGTTFSTRQYCEKDPGKQTNLTEKEYLEEACWNGLLHEMIPEICEQPEGNKKLYLWQIKEGNSFIELELGEMPEEKDNHFSIDPYSFTPFQLLS
jgi:hypothetical protein